MKLWTSYVNIYFSTVAGNRTRGPVDDCAIFLYLEFHHIFRAEALTSEQHGCDWRGSHSGAISDRYPHSDSLKGPYTCFSGCQSSTTRPGFTVETQSDSSFLSGYLPPQRCCSCYTECWSVSVPDPLRHTLRGHEVVPPALYMFAAVQSRLIDLCIFVPADGYSIFRL